MAAFEIDEVLDATEGTLILQGAQKGRMLRVQTDSREIKSGDLFLALKGEKFDGHEFVKTACKLGARGVIVEEARAAGDVDAGASGWLGSRHGGGGKKYSASLSGLSQISSIALFNSRGGHYRQQWKNDDEGNGVSRAGDSLARS